MKLREKTNSVYFYLEIIVLSDKKSLPDKKSWNSSLKIVKNISQIKRKSKPP